MVDGRNQEHLTTKELHELECFVEDLEYRVSLKLHGQKDADEVNDDENISPNDRPMSTFTPTKDNVSNDEEDTISSASASELSGTPGRPRPKKCTFLLFNPKRLYRYPYTAHHVVLCVMRYALCSVSFLEG
jgi:hypothetical protein